MKDSGCVVYRRGKWVVDYYDRAGKRKWITCLSREAAKDKLEEIRRERKSTSAARKPDVEFAEYSAAWLRGAQIQPKTRHSYGQILRLHLVPAFGAVPLREIQRAALKDFLSEKLAEGMSRNSVRLLYATLRVILNEAIEDEILDRNPALKLGRKLRLSTAPSQREEEIKALDRDQMAAFLDTARKKAPRYFELFLLMSRTGLRPAEAYALEWTDLDYGRGEMQICRALGHGRVVKGTKTGLGRTVDMSDQVKEALQFLEITRAEEARERGWAEIPSTLFVNEVGGYLDEAKVRQVFKRILRAAKLPGHHVPYGLRHSFASQLLAEGVSVAYVSAQLGHADIRLTVNL